MENSRMHNLVPQFIKIKKDEMNKSFSLDVINSADNVYANNFHRDKFLTPSLF